jgi:uncharacterized protein GlcG (DUF336 family)
MIWRKSAHHGDLLLKFSAFARGMQGGRQRGLPFGHPNRKIPIRREGGLPILWDGKVIGSIGVSGGTSPQDAQVAKAGVEALSVK